MVVDVLEDGTELWREVVGRLGGYLMAQAAADVLELVE